MSEIYIAQRHIEGIPLTESPRAPRAPRYPFRDQRGRFTHLADVRAELAELQSIQAEPPVTPPIVIQLPNSIGGEGAILAEKDMKRRLKEQKERSPKGYLEKLFWLADTQLLSLTHQEGLGAIMRYAEAEAHTFTHVFYGGDIFDFTQASVFGKDNAEGDRMTSDEIEAGKWFMEWTNKTFAHCKRIFTKGNHENRYKNFYENTNNGVKQWLVPFEEMFDLQGWEMYEYGQGQSYDWHGIKMWHGDKGGVKQNTPKLEVERAFRSVSFGHSPTNRSWEAIDADGNILEGRQHAGVSNHAAYSRNGYKQVSDGFGVYYWGKVGKQEVKNAYSIAIPINNPRFISPEGDLYDGTGFNLREAIGLDPKRGRPRKVL